MFESPLESINNNPSNPNESPKDGDNRLENDTNNEQDWEPKEKLIKGFANVLLNTCFEKVKQNKDIDIADNQKSTEAEEKEAMEQAIKLLNKDDAILSIQQRYGFDEKKATEFKELIDLVLENNKTTAEVDENKDNNEPKIIRMDNDEILSAISELTRSKAFQTERAYDKDMKKGISVFLKELVGFVKENKHDEKIERFAEEIRENLFSMTPNLSEGLTVDDHFELLAKMTRVPELQGNIGISMVGELVYKANWSSEESFKKILEKIEDAPVSEKMDMLEVTEMIFSQSLAEGWAENSAQSFKGIIKKFDEENKSFFIKSYLELAKERMDSEETSPTQGIIKMTGDRSNSRLQENLEEEEFLENIDTTEKIFSANRTLLPREKMMRIGEDAVAIIDHTNKPIEIAKVDPTSFEKEPLATKPRDLQDLNRAIEAFNQDPNSVRFDVLLMIMSQNSLFPEKSIDSWEKLAQKWEDTCGKIKMIPLDILQTPPDSDQPSIAGKESAEPVPSIRIKFNISQDRHRNGNSPEETKEILDEDLTENGWLEILQDLRKANRLSEANREKIIEGLSQKAQEIRTRQEGKFTEAEFMDYETLMQKYNYEFMKNENPEEIFLLLQHLHKPDMRQKIEEKLDIDFKQIPFAYQLHFLKFLSEKNEQEVDRVRDFLSDSTNEENRINRITSFLSLEAGEAMGEKILTIGEKLKPQVADDIFGEYAKVIDQIENIKKKIAEIFENRKDISDEEKNKISENLLQRADQMLIDFSMDINNQELDEDSLNKKILEGLENYRGDLMLTASMFRTLIKEEKRTDIRIEDFKNIRFQKSTAQELSVNGKLMEFVNKENLTGLNEQEIDNLNRIREMIKIYEENYKDKPEIRDGIVGGLKNILKEGSTDTEIYTLLQDNKVMAFCRFDENDTLYFGSFNVDDILKSSAIGTSFLRACLEEQEKKQKTIEADCIFKSAIGECYIDKVGFSANRVYLMEKEILLKIEKEPDEKSVYKKMTKEEIVSSYEQNFRENQYEESSPAIILCFDPSSEEMISKASELVNEKKYRITRYFSSVKNDKSVAYLVFEKTA